MTSEAYDWPASSQTPAASQQFSQQSESSLWEREYNAVDSEEVTSSASSSSRVFWTNDQTILLLEHLAQARNDGTLVNDRPAACAQVLRLILPEFNVAYPNQRIDARKLKRKLDEARGLYKAYLTAMARSGSSYDSATGFVEISSHNWQEVLRLEGDHGRRLRREGIKRIDLFQTVFPDTRSRAIAARESAERPRQTVSLSAEEEGVSSEPSSESASAPTGQKKASKSAGIPTKI
ncbi:hypothetical protein PWT90_10387 [Aphanocladium album]|nr:hypothetical protein PWT90_10387 [Aphanocladium album]